MLVWLAWCLYESEQLRFPAPCIGYFKGSLPCKAYLQQTSATTQADGKCSTNWRPGGYGLRKTRSSRPHWSALRAWTTPLKHLRDRTDSNDSARKGTFALADHCLLYLREEPSNNTMGWIVIPARGASKGSVPPQMLRNCFRNKTWSSSLVQLVYINSFIS
jgi:hypothetical protein